MTLGIYHHQIYFPLPKSPFFPLLDFSGIVEGIFLAFLTSVLFTGIFFFKEDREDETCFSFVSFFLVVVTGQHL